MATRLEQDYGNHPSPETRLEREGNVVRIEKPEGFYTIIYGIHSRPTEPQQLPERFDGLFLETGRNNYLEASLNFLKAFKGDRQYQPVFQPLEEKRIPIYFADAFLDEKVIALDSLVTGGEGGLAVIIASQIRKNGQISRRDFLRATASTWLLTPFVSSMGGFFFGDIGEEPIAELQKFSHRLHPEDKLLTLTVRNIIIAHKEQWLTERIGKGPHLATILGADHVGIEDWILNSPEERITFLYRSKPIWRPFVAPETVYQMVRFDFDGYQWQVGEIFEVPELKELVA